MAHKQTRYWSHLDFRHRSQVPLPTVDDVEPRLMEVLSPSWLAPRQLERRDPRQPQRLIRMRPRLLSLPVMVAIIVRLVWRRVPSMAEVQKVLAREGLWGCPPASQSPGHDHTARGAAGCREGAALCRSLYARAGPAATAPATSPLGTSTGALPAAGPCGRLDAGSPAQKDAGSCGSARGWWWQATMMGLVEAFSPRPLWQLYTEDAPAHDNALRRRSWPPCRWAGCGV